MRALFLIFLSSTLFLMNCTRPDQEPEFRRIDNLGVGKITGTEAVLTADAVFYNPNNVKVKLRKIDIDVELEGKRIGSINQDVNVKVGALSEFTVPLKASFDMSEIGLLNSIISFLGGKKVEVHFKGMIKVSVHGYPASVPVDYMEEIKF